MNKPKPKPVSQPAAQDSPLPTGPAPDLQTALFELQEQLELFGMARALLEQAQTRTDGQLEHWRELSQDQARQRTTLLKDMDGFFKQQTGQFTTLLKEQVGERQRLLESIKESQQTASRIAGNLDGVVTGLVRLKEQVKEAGFPDALDRLQAQIREAQNGVAGLDGRLDELQEHLEGFVQQGLRKAVTDMREAMRASIRDGNGEVVAQLQVVAREQGKAFGQQLEQSGERWVGDIQARLAAERKEAQREADAQRHRLAAFEKLTIDTLNVEMARLRKQLRSNVLLLAGLGGVAALAAVAGLVLGLIRG